MLCFRFRKLLVPYAEGALDERARCKVERHLASCAACRTELECLKSVSDALRTNDVPAAEPSPDLWARVKGQIEADTAPAPVRSRVPQAAYAFAAVAFVAVLGWSLVRPQMPSETARLAKTTPAAPPAARKVSQPPKSAELPAHKLAKAKPPSAEVLQPSPAKTANIPALSRRDRRTPLPNVPTQDREKVVREAIRPAEEAVPSNADVPELKPIAKASVAAAAAESVAGSAVKGNNMFFNAPAAPAADSLKTASATPAPAQQGLAPDVTASSVPLRVFGSMAASASAAPGTQTFRLASNSRKDSVSWYVKLGTQQMAAGQKTNATANFCNALTVAKPKQWHFIANSVKQSGALNLVTANAEKSFSANQDVKSGLVLYELQSVQQNQTGMLNTAQQLVTLDPKSAIGWLKLGEAYESAGNKTKALEAYAKAAAGYDSKIASQAKARIAKLRKSPSPN